MPGVGNGAEGNGSAPAVHPMDPLSAFEITTAASATKTAFPDSALRFNSISLLEPSKPKSGAPVSGDDGPVTTRTAEVVVIEPHTGRTSRVLVSLPSGTLDSPVESLPLGIQPAFSPDDCLLAEAIVKADVQVQQLLHDAYGISDMELVACDPWSVHIAGDRAEELLEWRGKESDIPARLIQTFLYRRDDADDNHYSHPISFLPVVDLNAERVVGIDGPDGSGIEDVKEDASKLRDVRPIPTASVNYHRNKVSSNSYLSTKWRTDVQKPLYVVQPEGPSFHVRGQEVEWQKWSFRVGFNWREGLVLHNVKFDERDIVSRASLVEMAVPYGDPQGSFPRKCAFDVGDYGLGFCTNSLELGCDCLGHIHYFDAVLNNCKGEPYEVKKAVCMHEEDAGLLWKHVEYRTGHSESRRARRLVLSFICTVVNYEYLFYWYFGQDGSLDFEIKLSGELSTNSPSPTDPADAPSHGVLVAPGVNAQIHQHMFCARLDMCVDGVRNCVDEVEIVPVPAKENPYGNAFHRVSTRIQEETLDGRSAAPTRVWKITNESVRNPITGQPVAYKLVPGTRGGYQPPLLTSTGSTVTKRAQFATKALWVTPYDASQRYPAGEFPAQGRGGEDCDTPWRKSGEVARPPRSVENEDIVLWHSFGIAHMPRPEDFPVMPCESVGFSLKPDGFFSGNPATDIPPSVDEASVCCSGA